VNVLLFAVTFLTCASLFPFYSEYIRKLKYENFLLRLGNTENSGSAYRFVRERGDFKIWKIEEDPDLIPQRGIGHNVFNNHPDPPAQGSNEVQPFCKGVVSEINEIVKSMRSNSLSVYGDVRS
jgi:hypothetical protein